MWVVAARTAALSVITGGGKWVEIKTRTDPLYQASGRDRRTEILAVESGKPPTLRSSADH